MKPLSPIELNSPFARQVKEKSGQPIDLCYQCQKCSSGCPMGDVTDITPTQLIRYIQLGYKDRVMNSAAMWLCLTCETCSVRCPNDIRIAEVVDSLREIFLGESINNLTHRVKTSIVAKEGTGSERNAIIFHKLFLDNIKFKGRIHETMVMSRYKIKIGDLFSDIDIGLKMFRKGKLPLIASSVKNKAHMRRIFERIEKIEKGQL